MSFAITELLGFAVFIPAVIGLIRFSKISPIYRPFIYCIWIGLANEIVSYFAIKMTHSNFANANCYMLIESILFTWQFKKWRLFEPRNVMFIVILIALALGWIIENAVFPLFKHYDSYFFIAYSFLLCLLSATHISQIMSNERGNLLKSPAFIICVAFIIYYIFSALSELFWVYGLAENKGFRENIAIIGIIANLVAIILYSIAILWMPIKDKFTLPFS
jgi:hypothetical protein